MSRFIELDETRAKVVEAFKELRSKHKLIARTNFSCCSTCAGAEIVPRMRKDDTRQGYAFWHRQDEDRWWLDGVLHIRYGGKPDCHSTDSAAIGSLIAELLRSKGLDVKYDGDPSRTITIHAKEA